MMLCCAANVHKRECCGTVTSQRDPDRLFSDARLAALYDGFCAERPDFAFYLPLVMSARSVLDIGCGTGGLLKLARANGHDGLLCGIDPAAGMIAVARQRDDIDWLLGTLDDLDGARRFDLIVMTGHALLVFVEDDAIRAMLRAVRGALNDGGRFAFETRNPNARAWEGWTPQSASVATFPDGLAVRMVRELTRRVTGDTVSFRHVFTSPQWREPEVSHSTLRFLSRDRLSDFLAGVGLAVETQYGDWDGSPVSDTSPEIITLARIA